MDNWFTIDKIDANTYIISEYRHWEETHCYLLNGNTRSLLIDTGLAFRISMRKCCNLLISQLRQQPRIFTGVILEDISISRIFMSILMNWIG
jgi:hypothetical protein